MVSSMVSGIIVGLIKAPGGGKDMWTQGTTFKRVLKPRLGLTTNWETGYVHILPTLTATTGLVSPHCDRGEKSKTEITSALVQIQ